jgi:hypothetical protein
MAWREWLGNWGHGIKVKTEMQHQRLHAEDTMNLTLTGFQLLNMFSIVPTI